MTRKELEHIQTVLNKIKNPDGNVIKALAYVEKNLRIFDACKGQIKDNYEIDTIPW
jgi:hypothetical protein